jgi:hypothetical protein
LVHNLHRFNNTNSIALVNMPTADKDLKHVRLADEAVCIGPHPSADSYLNIPALISAAEVTHSHCARLICFNLVHNLHRFNNTNSIALVNMLSNLNKCFRSG